MPAASVKKEPESRFGAANSCIPTGWGTDTDFDAPLIPARLGPPVAGPPALAQSSYAQIFLTIRPSGKLTVDNTYLLSRVRNLSSGPNIINLLSLPLLSPYRQSSPTEHDLSLHLSIGQFVTWSNLCYRSNF